MSIRAVLCAVLGLSLGGCVAYGDDRPYYRQYDNYGGYNVQYYETYPSYRVYRYYDDDRRYSDHHDRYQERRHSHYAPGYDGRYDWRNDRHRSGEQPRYGDRQRYGEQQRYHEQRRHSEQPRYGWDRREGNDERRQGSWLRPSDRRDEGRREERRHEGERRQQRSSHQDGQRDWRIAN